MLLYLGNMCSLSCRRLSGSNLCKGIAALLFSQILPGGKSAARGKLQLVHQLEYAFHTKDGEEVGDELIISSTVMSTGLLRVGGVAP